MRVLSAFIVSTNLFTSVPAFAQNCPETPTKYTISLPSPEKAHIEIDTTVASKFLVMAGFVAKDGAAAPDFVETVKIAGAGKEVTLQHGGNGAFPITDFEIGEKAKVSYDLRLDHGNHAWDFGKEEIGTRIENGAYLVSRVTMLADYGAAGCPIDVEFKTSDSAAPWTVTGKNQYRAESLDAFHNNAFAFGDHIGRFTAETPQGRVTFIHDRASKALAKRAAEDTSRMTAHLATIFGGFPASNYHIFLLENDHPEGGAFKDSFAMLHPSPAQDVDSLIWRHGFLHEIIHLWLGLSIRPAEGADIEWFKEGFTDYLAVKTLWRLGYLNDLELAEKLENLIRRHVMGFFISQGQVKLSEAGAQKAENRMIIYGGGATLAFMLDVKMSADQKPGAFENMLATMYANSKNPYTEYSLLTALNEATDNYAGELLNQFDEGMLPMQIAPMLEAYGLEMAFMVPDMYQLDLSPQNCTRSRCKPAFLQVKRYRR